MTSQTKITINRTPAIAKSPTDFTELLSVIKSLPQPNIKRWNGDNKTWDISGSEPAICNYFTNNGVTITTPQGVVISSALAPIPTTATIPNGDTKIAITDDKPKSDYAQYVMPGNAMRQTELLELSVNTNSFFLRENEKDIVLQVVAVMRLFEGRVAGKMTEYGKHGETRIIATGNSSNTGNLTPDEALLVLKKAMTYNVDPSSLHVWYSKSLQIMLPFYIELGLAQHEAKIQGEKFETYTRSVSPDDLPSCKTGDICNITYIRKITPSTAAMSENVFNSVFTSLMKNNGPESIIERVETAKQAAWEATCNYKGVGIVPLEENSFFHKKDKVWVKRDFYITGKSWDWVSGKRSYTDAVRRLFHPSPMAIASYRHTGSKFSKTNLLAANDPDYDMGLAGNEKMIDLIETKNNPNTPAKQMTQEQRVSLMHGEENDEGFD